LYNQEDHRGVFEEKAFNYGAEKTMNVALVWDVVKWVLVVLVAGFIGQFGRVLALRLIERHRAKKVYSHDRSDGGSARKGEVASYRENREETS